MLVFKHHYHTHLDAVVIGCTEFPLIVDQSNSALPMINPVYLQTRAAVDYALEGKEIQTS
ncbi:MAG TPA: hypothetical protein PLY23_01420 [Alphaproteobacteria bacterium]|nr:hypothetical protein [Alphaproteobacteria bacterium]HQS93343.1 hypothetical protein [Alphaproteobacteria bacterium]